MPRLILVRLRRLLGDWRFLLAFAGLALLLHWETTGPMIDSSAGKFLKRYDTSYFSGVSPRSVAHNLGLDEYGPDGFETMYDVWEAYKQGSPTRTEYHFLGAVCNPGLSRMLAFILLSLWVAGEGQGASAAVRRGHRRFSVFLASALAYFALTMLLCAGMLWLELRTLPIGFRWLPEGYAKKTVGLWLLFTASDACLFAFAAFAFRPFAAVSFDLGLLVLRLLRPAALVCVFPLGVTAEKDCWRIEAGFGTLEKAAVAAAVVLALALMGAWLAFRRKEL